MFDNFLLNGSADQVVVLAAGLDGRAFRLTWAAPRGPVRGRPAAGGVADVAVWLPAGLGAVLVVGFVLRSRRRPDPLIDLGLFRDRQFSVAVVTMAQFSVAFFGVMLLFPTYFLLVRGESALAAGLLMPSQGVGALITMPIAGKLADRIGAGRVVLPGLVAS